MNFSLVLFRGYSTEAVRFIREYECGLKSVTKELLHFIQTATSDFQDIFQTSYITCKFEMCNECLNCV